MVEPIQLALAAAGYEVFFDQESLQAGDDYNGRIQQAIRTCDAFVFVATTQSLADGKYTLSELKFARQRWASPAGRVLAVNASNLQSSVLPPYLTAATLLQTKGNIAAEVRAAVDVMLDRQQSVERLSRQVAAGKRRKNTYALAAAIGCAMAVALAFVAYPRVQLMALGCQVHLDDVRNRWVREHENLRVADGWRCILLAIDDVKVKTLSGQGPGEVHASFRVDGIAQSRVVSRNEPKTVVLNDKEYQLQVHDFSDVQIGADQAEITLSVKK